MKHKNSRTIAEILPELLEEQGLTATLQQAAVFKAWDDSLGATVARLSHHKSFSGGLLRVHIESPVLRHQLQMQQTLITDRLNTLLGSPLVKQIQLLR